jgi:hypothetical protein
LLSNATTVAQRAGRNPLGASGGTDLAHSRNESNG